MNLEKTKRTVRITPAKKNSRTSKGEVNRDLNHLHPEGRVATAQLRNRMQRDALAKIR